MITDKKDSKYKHMYVWLNINTGEFSNSWTEETDIFCGGTEEPLPENKSPYKLIRFECLNDEKFEFTNHMKLR